LRTNLRTRLKFLIATGWCCD